MPSTERSSETARRALLFLVGGGSYTVWSLLSPAGAVANSIWGWASVSAAFIVVSAIVLVRAPAQIPLWFYGPTFLATAHLQALSALNPGQPFFAVASVMIVLSAVPLMHDRAALAVYSAFVLLLCGLQLWYGAAATAFLAVGVAWMTLLAGGWARSQAKTAARLRETRSELAHERSERQRLESELAQAQRMDSLGRLAGAFSHEFNNQLMAIRIHADLLARSLPGDAPQRRDVAQIQQTTSSAADLTARLLAFSRPNRTREEPADLCAALRQNLVTLRHLMAEHTPVAISLPEDSVFAPVGAKQLGQILLNLALNARDAMPLGGTLRLEVARIPRRSVELPVDIPGDELARLTVSDTGTGMGPDVLDHLYEPFFTTKADRGNSGLGLSVVYGLVKDTGGHIRVTSEPGAGARFDIYWPIATRSAEGALPERVAQRPPPRARVLLVEDQPVLREGLTRWLGDQGYAVVPCESAEEALPRVGSVDVIASDVVLPGMDGIELLDHARRAAPELPAVLFSGHLDHLAARRRQIPDGVMFLEKPFAPEALQTTLEALVGRRLRPAAVH